MRATRSGFVLVAALWLLVALGAVGMDAALRSKARRLPAANLIDETRAREAALAGGEYAQSRLTAAMREYELALRAEVQRRGVRPRRIAQGPGQADNPWREPAQLMDDRVALGDLQFQLDVHDTGRMLNINLATEDMLRAFFAQGLRLDYPTADGLTQAILDWRDEDDLPRVNGAEREQYLDEDAVVLPGNRPFADVDELRHVLGMTPELLETIRPLVRVIGSARLNVNAAPVEVLSALPGFTPAQWASFVRQREAGRYAADAAELRSMLGMNRRGRDMSEREEQEFGRYATFSTNEVTIVSEGYITESPVRERVTLIVVQARNGAVVVWRRME
jgi:general secretion pathway protein K